ncbi:MAG: hypothetical protein NUV40_04060 [Patescibacteria group bacterium]|nr:hypothetical protein [Patescibacteria group bacterium]
MKRIKNRSEEMLRQRAQGPFGSRSLPTSNTFGPTEKDLSRFLTTRDLLSISCGLWTKNEILFLLRNKENKLNLLIGKRETIISCPSERRDELIQILQEKFRSLIFEEDGNLRYIAMGNVEGVHVLLWHDSGNCTLIMHCTETTFK